MDGERSANVHLAFDLDAPIVSLNDLFADRKSKPCTGGFAFVFAYAIELLK